MGKADTAARKRATRGGRMRGCTINITADELEAAGIDPEGPVPWYRVVGIGKRHGGGQRRPEVVQGPRQEIGPIMVELLELQIGLYQALQDLVSLSPDTCAARPCRCRPR